MIKGNWIPFDKRAVHLLPKDNKPFTVIEAMLSYSIDRDNKHHGSINGYASLWKWSRDKVRRFIQTIEKGEDYYPTGKKTGNHTNNKQVIRYVLNKLESTKNSYTDREPDRQDDSTIDPYNPLSLNPTKKENKGIFPKDEKSSPLSFEKFIKEKIKKNPKEDVDMKKIKTIAYFLDIFQATQGDQHPYLKPDQWQRAIDNILTLDGEDLEEDDIETIIDSYFGTKFQQGCNYSILHFISGDIKNLRFYEKLY
jgi:hypothetical protein